MEAQTDILQYETYVSLVSTTVGAGGLAVTQSDLLLARARALHYFILLGAVNGGAQFRIKMQSSPTTPFSLVDIPGTTTGLISPVASTKYAARFRSARLPDGHHYARMVVEVVGGTSIVITALWHIAVGFPKIPMPGVHINASNSGILENDTNGNARFLLDW